MRKQWIYYIVGIIGFIILAFGLYTYYTHFRLKNPVAAFREVTTSNPEYLWRVTELEILSQCSLESGKFEHQVYQERFESFLEQLPGIPDNAESRIVALYDDRNVLAKEVSNYCPILLVHDSSSGESRAVFNGEDGNIFMLEVVKPVAYFP